MEISLFKKKRFVVEKIETHHTEYVLMFSKTKPFISIFEIQTVESLCNVKIHKIF